MQAESIFEAVGGTPLVELTRVSPPDNARAFVKLEGVNPASSMKDRMALATIKHAERDGQLSPGQRVVERTGGS